jgi:hypothetical protein
MSDQHIDKVRIEVDYFGNIYIRFRDRCYNILFDGQSERGMELDRISTKCSESMRYTLNDYPHLAQHVKRGEIVLSEMTLKGRVTQIMKEMNDEELAEHVDINNFTSHDSSFKEAEFFRIERVKRIEVDNDQESDLDLDDWDIIDNDETYDTSTNIEYRFSEIIDFADIIEPTDSMLHMDPVAIHPHIMFSNMLNVYASHNDTILINGGLDSKLVESNIRRTDEYCSKRLVFYTDGFCKIQYPNTCSIYSKFIYRYGELDLEFIKKIEENNN